MNTEKWSEKEVLKFTEQKDEIIRKLVHTLANDTNNIFAAKLGFGIPRIDLVAVTKLRTIDGYVIRFPIVDGSISSLPYYQGIGEATFLLDQMVNEPYLLVPDYDFEENVPFVFESDVVKRVSKRTYDIGIAVFGKDYSIRKLKTPLPRARKYFRLELELADSILKHGEIEVGTGKENDYRDYTQWVDAEFASVRKILMEKKDAETLCHDFLRDRGFYSVKMRFKEAEIQSTPRPIPIFIVEGEGSHLGEGEKFKLFINRISGRITWQC